MVPFYDFLTLNVDLSKVLNRYARCNWSLSIIYQSTDARMTSRKTWRAVLKILLHYFVFSKWKAHKHKNSSWRLQMLKLEEISHQLPSCVIATRCSQFGKYQLRDYSALSCKLYPLKAVKIVWENCLQVRQRRKEEANKKRIACEQNNA